MDFIYLDKQLENLLCQQQTPSPQVKCKNCGETDSSKFRKHVRGSKTFLAGKCKNCQTEQRQLWRSKNPARVGEYDKTRRSKISKQREDPKYFAKFIFLDCKHSDTKIGRENDLDLEFVQDQISKGCRYCNTLEGRLTLDRVDNSKGHTKDNVVPSCLRCNYTRGSMPYNAWLAISPAMETARTLNLFSDWEYKHFDFSK